MISIGTAWRGITVLALGVSLVAAPLTRAQENVLNGAGATFPAPLYSKWSDEYFKATGVKVNYQSIGSGGGIKSITDRTVDFGASDAPMNDEQLAAAPAAILHIPAVLGAVVVTYNLPNLTTSLKLTPDVVADIFLGKITRWDDGRIQQLNPGASLPGADIVVVHRSDGSGTTFVFTDYLSKVSEPWATQVGKGTTVNWPVGLGAKGNEGVAGEVKQIPNSIGYVELAYAQQNNLARATLQNADGQWIEPSLSSTSAAAAGVAARIPDDLRVSITNASGPESYPIASFTYLLVYRDQTDKAKAQTLVDYIAWGLTQGQKLAPELLYAPLPPEVQRLALLKLATVNVNGQVILDEAKVMAMVPTPALNADATSAASSPSSTPTSR